jgi:hypothetical protein
MCGYLRSRAEVVDGSIHYAPDAMTLFDYRPAPKQQRQQQQLHREYFGKARLVHSTEVHFNRHSNWLQCHIFMSCGDNQQQ